jgi:hypothetical protein
MLLLEYKDLQLPRRERMRRGSDRKTRCRGPLARYASDQLR